MTPYHTNVFKRDYTKHIIHMSKVDSIARALAIKNN